MRKHYMTLCLRGNVEITHIVNNGRLEVTFEQARNGGFDTLVTDIDGRIIKRDGFTDSDVDFYLRFLRANREGIIAESKGEI